jgi:hypothetical protein
MYRMIIGKSTAINIGVDIVTTATIAIVENIIVCHNRKLSGNLLSIISTSLANLYTYEFDNS